MNARTISVCFVDALLARLALTEFSREQLLQESGLSSKMLSEEKSRISPSQFAQLFRNAMRHCGDEACGHFPQRMKPGSFRTISRYVANSQDLREAFHRNIEIYSLFETGFSLHLDIDGKFASYRMQEDGCTHQNPWVFEQHLMIHHRFLSWLVGTPIALQEVTFHYPVPPHRDEYHFLFPCPHRFQSGSTRLVFESRLLDLPVVKTSRDVENQIRQAPYNLLFQPTQQRNFSETIRRYIKKSLPNQPSYEQIAHSLNLTPQTLRRRLRDEGCDFRQIRNELLRDIAIENLEQTDSSIQEISFQLGFSEPSAFIRSFRKWTGTSPNHYRQERLSD